MDRDASNKRYQVARLELKRQGARSAEAERAREQRANPDVFGIQGEYMGPPVNKRTNTRSGFYEARASARRKKWEGTVSRNRSKYAAWKRNAAAKYPRHADDFQVAIRAAENETTAASAPRPRKKPTGDRMGGSRTGSR